MFYKSFPAMARNTYHVAKAEISAADKDATVEAWFASLPVVKLESIIRYEVQ